MATLTDVLGTVGVRAFGVGMPVIAKRWTDGTMPTVGTDELSLELSGGSWVAPLPGTVRRLDAAPLHVLSAFATELGAVIGDLVVPPEANEITAALTLLKGLPLEGAIVTGDAIFAQREICRHVRDAEGHSLFVVKTNQPELHRDIAISADGAGECARRGADQANAAGRAKRARCATGTVRKRNLV